MVANLKSCYYHAGVYIEGCPECAESTRLSQNPDLPAPGSAHTTAYVALIFHGTEREWASYAESLSSDSRIRTVGATVVGDPSCGQCTASSSRPGTSITVSAETEKEHAYSQRLMITRRGHVHTYEMTCDALGCEPA